jgi:hypothetical protein
MNFIRFLCVSLKQAEPRANPRLMALEVLGFVPDYWQGEALDAFPHCPGNRDAACSRIRGTPLMCMFETTTRESAMRPGVTVRQTLHGVENWGQCASLLQIWRRRLWDYVARR